MSITDGTFVCSLCGEWMTGCALCGFDAPLKDIRRQIAEDEKAAADAALELHQQSRSIRQAAERRRGETW